MIIAGLQPQRANGIAQVLKHARSSSKACATECAPRGLRPTDPPSASGIAHPTTGRSRSGFLDEPVAVEEVAAITLEALAVAAEQLAHPLLELRLLALVE